MIVVSGELRAPELRVEGMPGGVEERSAGTAADSEAWDRHQTVRMHLPTAPHTSFSQRFQKLQPVRSVLNDGVAPPPPGSSRDRSLQDIPLSVFAP
jgi:hypothetical protein